MVGMEANFEMTHGGHKQIYTEDLYLQLEPKE